MFMLLLVLQVTALLSIYQAETLNSLLFLFINVSMLAPCSNLSVVKKD